MVKINPVKATRAKYESSDCQMADVNNTCYEICAAFSGTTDPYNMDPACTKACDDYIEQRRLTLYGVGWCDHHAPNKPVIWNQVPNFVPNLVRKGVSPNQALQQGMEMCAKYVPTLVEECKNKCQLHYNAIEQYEKVASPNSSTNKKTSKIVMIVVAVIIALVFLFIVIQALRR